MLWITRPFLEVENSNVRKYIFGSAGSLGERGVSGPKKITVGCVIFTVPRRQSVSHAFTAEIAKATPEIVIEIGSAIAVLTGGFYYNWLQIAIRSTSSRVGIITGAINLGKEI